MSRLVPIRILIRDAQARLADLSDASVDCVIASPPYYRLRDYQVTGQVVSVDSDQPLPVQLDGEQPGTTPVRFELVPRALRLRVPAR